jgi:iron donor protein CyaY
MLDESRFHAIANATLMHLFDQLEDAFERGDFEELDLQGGILTIETLHGQTLLLSKHTPSCQLWLASPISGGLHFDYDETEQEWLLSDGTHLKTILAREMLKLADVKVIF